MKKENLVKFYQTYRLYIFPAIVALSSMFLILFAIYPQIAKLVSNQQAVGDLIKKSNFLETKVQALESYNEEELSRKVEFVLAAYPQDKDFVGIIGLLQQVVAQSGFVITSISLGNTSSKVGTSDSFEVKLEARGARALFSTLLNNLENSRRLIKVNDIDISAGNVQAMDASITIGVLYSSIPQTFGTIDSPLQELTQKDEELIATIARSVTVASPSATQFAPRGKSNPFE